MLEVTNFGAIDVIWNSCNLGIITCYAVVICWFSAIARLFPLSPWVTWCTVEERERGHGGDQSRCTGRVGEVCGGGGYGDWRDDVKEEEED